MKRTALLLTGFFLCAFILCGLRPNKLNAHGGLGGFHAAGVHSTGFHAGGVEANGFHAGGLNHVGYYPHFNPAVGYYHPVARGAAWSAAYNNGVGYGGYNPYAYQQPNPYPSPSSGASSTASGDGSSGAGALNDAAAQAQQKLEAELNSGGKDK